MKNILILLIVICVIGISIYIYLNYFYNVSKPENVLQFDNSEKEELTCKPEVFHLRDNIYTYDEANAACSAFNCELADIYQLKNAYKNGANWCSYGWSKDQLALYPTQKSEWDKLQTHPSTTNNCGKPGINGGKFDNKLYKFGANCYGLKPKIKKISPNNIEYNKMIDKTHFDNLEESYKIIKDDLNISPFSSNRWFE